MLEGKVALITGAARGIGKAIALKFAEEGADVAFTDLVINEAAEETISEIAAFGHKVKGYASNAANFDETHAVVEEILKDFGRIDILVNNAGITKDGLVMRMSEAQWDAVIAVNLKSAFNFIHAVIPQMSRQKGGSIINMASIAGQMGNPGPDQLRLLQRPASSRWPRPLRKRWAPAASVPTPSPRVSVVTEMTNALPEAVREEYIKNIPLKRGATVEEIANTALYLGVRPLLLCHRPR
jgi:Dehydrogenases with different specificities (related to short-chain alcohol dehydrogenases)